MSCLAYLAGRTERIQLGISVLVLPYRHPLYWARVAASVDLLLLVTDPRAPEAEAALRVPALRSSIALVTQPSGRLDPAQPIMTFPL